MIKVLVSENSKTQEKKTNAEMNKTRNKTETGGIKTNFHSNFLPLQWILRWLMLTMRKVTWMRKEVIQNWGKTKVNMKK